VIDYNKVCWYCGSFNMMDMGDFVKCRKCGATNNDAPVLGVSSSVLEPFGSKNPPVKGSKAHRRPSAFETRKAAKAREKAKAK
jgi:hypothetical protein